MKETDIRLVEPKDGAVTRPLQRCYWPTDTERETGLSPCADAAVGLIDWDELEVGGKDRSTPEPVLFLWEFPETSRKRVSFDLRISTSPDFRGAHVLPDLRDQHAAVFHLHIATRYFWKVAARRAGVTISDSPVWSFSTHQATPRWISVPGITNVRDLGGWPLPGGRRVRQGLVYRSSEMNSHITITEKGKRILTDELGIRTDLDLRGSTEEVRPVLDPDRVEWINIQIQPYAAIGDDVYKDMYRQVFEIFADASRYPILFHCWGGADRAGTVAFLLNALLGKSRDNLIRDYELTSLSLSGPRRRCAPEFQAMLFALESYGPAGNLAMQVENYLLSIGVGADRIRQIRELLIVPAEDHPQVSQQLTANHSHMA